MYTIKIDYSTGDSFNTYDTDTTLSGEWTLEVAKENLKRIKSHYTLYQNRNNYYSMGMQVKGKDILEDAKKEVWFYSDDNTYGIWEYCLNLLENDGSVKKYDTCWIGYFERLISARVISITPEDDEMNFTP